MKNPKAVLAFILATVFCVLAVITRFTESPLFVPVILIIIAAVALVYGLSLKVSKTVDQPVIFSSEQITQLQELKENGQESAAIRQAQLWSRGASNEAVIEAVRKL